MERCVLFVFLLGVPCCSSIKLYDVHGTTGTFEEALKSCNKVGLHLTDIRNEEKVNFHLLPLLLELFDTQQNRSMDFWIGLKKSKGDCSEAEKPLKGLKWIVDDSTDSKVNKWKKVPEYTCTAEQCGLLSVDFKGSNITDWGFIAQRCTRKQMFICSKLSDGPFPPRYAEPPPVPGKTNTVAVPCQSKGKTIVQYSKTDQVWKWENGSIVENRDVCSICIPGYIKTSKNTCKDVDKCKSNPCDFRCNNTEGSFFCMCKDGYALRDDGKSCQNLLPTKGVTNDAVTQRYPNVFLSQQPPSKKNSPPTDSPKVSSPTSVSQIENNKFNIFKPVLIALSALVALVVIVLIIVKCCLIKKSKKFKVKEGPNSKEAVDLKGMDSEEHEESLA